MLLALQVSTKTRSSFTQVSEGGRKGGRKKKREKEKEGKGGKGREEGRGGRREGEGGGKGREKGGKEREKNEITLQRVVLLKSSLEAIRVIELELSLLLCV